MNESPSRFYQKHGYLVVEQVFTHQKLEGVRRRTELILHYATAEARSENPRLNEEVTLEID